VFSVQHHPEASPGRRTASTVRALFSRLYSPPDGSRLLPFC
jgi:carbamoylphosphate synthase small subunit